MDPLDLFFWADALNVRLTKSLEPNGAVLVRLGPSRHPFILEIGDSRLDRRHEWTVLVVNVVLPGDRLPTRTVGRESGPTQNLVKLDFKKPG